MRIANAVREIRDDLPSQIGVVVKLFDAKLVSSFERKIETEELGKITYFRLEDFVSFSDSELV